MAEPAVDLERSVGVWEQHADWPIPGTRNVNFWLRPGTDGAGGLALAPSTGAPTDRSFVDDPQQFEAAMIGNPDQVTPNRLAFLSPPLATDLRVSGTPVAELTASSSLDEAYLGAILVEYGPSTQNDRTGDGIRQTTLPEECYGQASAHDDGCYRPVEYRPVQVSQWRVTKGIIDGRNRDSITTAEPMVPGEMEQISFPLLPSEHVFQAGNRLGVILVTPQSVASAWVLAEVGAIWGHAKPVVPVLAEVDVSDVPAPLKPHMEHAVDARDAQALAAMVEELLQ